MTDMVQRHVRQFQPIQMANHAVKSTSSIPIPKFLMILTVIFLLSFGALLQSNSLVQESFSFYSIPDTAQSTDPPVKVGIGLITVHNSNPVRSTYLYATLTILVSAVAHANPGNVLFSPINIYAGSADESNLKYLKYDNDTIIRSITPEFKEYESDPVSVRGTYNYQRALDHLSTEYAGYDAVLLLEDDVIMVQDVGEKIAHAIRTLHNASYTHWFVDAYVASFQFYRDEKDEMVGDLIKLAPRGGKCCTQAYLYSISAARSAANIVKAQLNTFKANRKSLFTPYDLLINTEIIKEDGFAYFAVPDGWVQHIGKSTTGLGFDHHGISRMTF